MEASPKDKARLAGHEAGAGDREALDYQGAIGSDSRPLAPPSLSEPRLAKVTAPNFIPEVPMCWTNLVVLAAILLPVVGAGGVVSAQAPAGGVTAFEGARLIVGDGRAPNHNGDMVV